MGGSRQECGKTNVVEKKCQGVFSFLETQNGRKLGCFLIVGINEEKVRAQRMVRVIGTTTKGKVTVRSQNLMRIRPPSSLGEGSRTFF